MRELVTYLILASWLAALALLYTATEDIAGMMERGDD